MTKNNMKLVVAGVLATSLCGVGFAQTELLVKPAANLTEKWDSNGSGWVKTNNSFSVNPNSGWTNGMLAIKCAYQATGSGFAETWGLVAKPVASGGIFFGDYSKIEAVSFDVQPYDMTISPTFYFKAASSERKWSVPFLGDYANGQKFTVTIPLIYSTNWVGSYKPDAAAKFGWDKTNIFEVGFEFFRGINDLKAQSFAVDNMKLLGDWTGPFSNGVPLAWVMEAGLTNQFADAGLADNDNDSFSNAAEFLAGTDPTNSSSFFKIEIVRDESGKMVVKWNGNRNVNYEVREASNLGSDAVFVTMTNISPTTVKTEEVAVGETEGNAKFFKVLITPKE